MLARLRRWRPIRWVRLTWRANPQWHHLPGELLPHLFLIALGILGYRELDGPVRLLCVGLASAAGLLLAWAVLLVLLNHRRV